MIANKSVLQLRDFVIVKSRFDYESFNQDEYIEFDQALKIIDEYVIDVDFGFQEKKDKSGGLYLFTKVSVNQVEQPLPGPSIFVEAVCFIEQSVIDQIPANDRLNQLSAPAMNYSVNQIRAYMAQITAASPLGKYLLPSIDLMSLFAEKKVRREKALAEKERRPVQHPKARAKTQSTQNESDSLSN